MVVVAAAAVAGVMMMVAVQLVMVVMVLVMVMMVVVVVARFVVVLVGGDGGGVRVRVCCSYPAVARKFPSGCHENRMAPPVPDSCDHCSPIGPCKQGCPSNRSVGRLSAAAGMVVFRLRRVAFRPSPERRGHHGV